MRRKNKKNLKKKRSSAKKTKLKTKLKKKLQAKKKKAAVALKKSMKPPKKKKQGKPAAKTAVKALKKKLKIADKAKKKDETSLVHQIKQREAAQKISGILASAEIRQMLIEVGGENALSIIKNFYGNHSDDELAKKLKLKISDVRATLNKLHNEGLVNYVREKDNETGWYSYSWSLNMIRIEKWVDNQKGRLGGLGADENELYFCPSCGESSIVDFENASDMQFRCERCNKMLEFLDSEKITQLLEKKI